MRAVTIDQLDIKNHERYAKDQEVLESKYITDSRSIGPYSEIAGTSSIFPSNWETLFELQNRNLPWAAFTQPEKYTIQSNRFFSYQVLPSIYISDEDEEEDEEEDEDAEEQEHKKHANGAEFINKISNAVKGRKQSVSDFEHEKSTLLNLIDSIKYLDKILSQINARKRQYQKG